jgi:hypothetical protein
VSPNLALWLANDGDALAVAGLFFDTRSSFDATPAPLATADTRGLAPDRLPGQPPRFELSAQGLRLAAGASVVVTDATYADVEVRVDFPTGAPATLLLRGEGGRERGVGGADCPLPPPPAEASLVVRRRLGQLTGGWRGGAAFACVDELVGERVRVALRAPLEADAVVRNLRLLRLEVRR